MRGDGGKKLSCTRNERPYCAVSDKVSLRDSVRTAKAKFPNGKPLKLGGCCVTQCFPEFVVRSRRFPAVSLGPLKESLVCQTHMSLLRDRLIGRG